MTPAELIANAPEPEPAPADELAIGAVVRYHLDRDSHTDATITDVLPNAMQWDLQLADGRVRLGVRRGFGSRQPGTFDTLAEVEFSKTRGQRRTVLPDTAPVTSVAPDGNIEILTADQIAAQRAANEQAASVEADETTATTDQTSPKKKGRK